MTTAHRPTFDPARGQAQKGPAYHTRDLAAHTRLKVRQPGQGGIAETQKRDLRAQLRAAEAAHYAKIKGTAATETEDDITPDTSVGAKRRIEGSKDVEVEGEEDLDAKRRRVLEETRDIDADSDESEDESSSDQESEDGDGEAALIRQLAEIKAERAGQREREEQEKAAQEQEQREKDIAMGNPLLNPSKDYNVKRRWDDDVVFKNQARGTEDKRKKEFVNDLLRSDFHKRFMSKYVR